MEEIQDKQENNLLQQLPKSFENFLSENKINKNIFTDIEYLQNLPRYIRIKPGFQLQGQELIDKLVEELQCEQQDIQKIEWIDDMYSVKSSVKIAGSDLYKNGILYGIDLASAACVLALDIQGDDKVLDLCCAPATKLCYIGDLQKYLSKQNNEEKQKFEVQSIGVDISENRLNTSRNIVKKYKLDDIIQLLLGDGTKYENEQKFDKVLVDAECTHDGSVKHLLKFIKNQFSQQKNNDNKVQGVEQEKMSRKEKKLLQKQKQQQEQQFEKNNCNVYTQEINKKMEWSVEDFEQRFMDPKKMDNICSLQYNLLQNGFRNLKQGGILVYSTCTFARKQNEDIVDQFIKENEGKVELLEVYSEQKFMEIGCQKGFNGKSVRFDPINNKTGGLFISKMKKI